MARRRTADGTIDARGAGSFQAADSLRTRFIEQAIVAQEDERRRISRELHDEIGQALTSLLIGLKNLESMVEGDEAARESAQKLRDIASNTLDEVGRLARGLRPAVLDDLGLAPAVKHQAEEFARAHGIMTDVHVIGLDEDRLPATVEITLYRILQEALTNVIKHADASLASVVLERRGAEVRLIVEDNGKGIEETTSPKDGRPGLGVQGIRERVALLRGEVTIESTANAGTTLHVHIPLESDVKAFWVRHRGNDLRLAPGSYLIGRSRDCHLMLDTPQVSRKHARLVVTDSAVTVEDLGSTNGVYVNRLRIETAHALKDGDSFSVGDDEFTVSSELPLVPEQLERSRNRTEPQQPEIIGGDPTEQSMTLRNDAFIMVARLAEKMFTGGRGTEAESVLKHHLHAILRRLLAGEIVPADLVGRAGPLAVCLAVATKKGEWLDYAVELFSLSNAVMSDEVLSELAAAARQVEFDCEALSGYAIRLRLMGREELAKRVDDLRKELSADGP